MLRDFNQWAGEWPVCAENTDSIKLFNLLAAGMTTSMKIVSGYQF